MISYKFVHTQDKEIIRLIAGWYADEWQIPVETTSGIISGFPISGWPFHLIMMVDGIPVAAGGVAKHVRLLDREPRFNAFSPWLALVYTVPEHRNLGYGSLLCEEIIRNAAECGLKELFLYTHTAESLYKRLGWQVIEYLELNSKNLAIMKYCFTNLPGF